ncbi:Beta-amyrin 28-monooxygenase [Camellia lanceoleosa]|uniref:Beta-amyrin 28-monooxygenase n=1 Tax=Camellia lanceoleosa TaxID=1840588 RepID=A0ACC0GMG7_9ERIC|nr:Beta-amyrin 28-monooxygenase [Camellia lanceoleosa]
MVLPLIKISALACLVIHNEDNSALLSDEEIEDNAVIIMIGGYDTSSILLTFLIRLLANEPSIYAAIVQEKEEIAKARPWGASHMDDLNKMKYTWRVAMETLRITPHGFCSFRRVLKDIEFGGCPIPKRWQVVWAASMTHMDETIFPNPSKIDPTRFEQQAPVTCCLVAFRRPRMCPRYEFARIETLALLGDLVHM